MKPVNLELHVEELVLHGFAPGDRYRIGEALERTLTQLFVEQGVSASVARDGEIEQLDAGAFEVSSGSRPEVIGAELALIVYGGLRE
jgi:hypothetical protein